MGRKRVQNGVFLAVLRSEVIEAMLVSSLVQEIWVLEGATPRKSVFKAVSQPKNIRLDFLDRSTDLLPI